MPLLNLLPPLTNASDGEFKQQTSQAFNSLQSWQSLILSNVDVDYVQSNSQNVQSTNFTYAGNTYKNIPNFSFNFAPKNKLAIVSMSLTIQGTGFVGVILNGQVLREIPFLNGVFSQVSFNRIENFSTSTNKINLALRSTAGMITFASSIAQPFLNYFQIVDINS